MTFRSVAAAALLLAACASSTPAPPPDRPVPADWLKIAESPRYQSLSYDPGGVLLQVSGQRAASDVRIVTVGDKAKLVNGSKELTPPFPAIDSFDVSLERREVVFSAERADNFDVGLVSLDGSEIHWVPEDPSDEISVQWAPRGNKISYIVRSRGGDLVRTVHVPTSMQQIADFPFGRVHALAWEPKAERYAASWSSADASDRVEVLTYDGSERKIVTPPAAKLAVEVEPIGGALMLHPAAIRYNEKIPLVVWRTGDRNEWSDARAALEREFAIACAIIDHEPDAAFWSAVTSIPWIDSGRVYLVGVNRAGAAGGVSAPPAATSGDSGERSASSPPAAAVWIVADESVPAGHYRESGRTVSVAPALVQSVGAAWVAHQLKGHPPANGSHR